MASGRAVSAETLAVLESWQWPAEDKLARCDEVVDNTGSMEATRGAVRSLQKRLAERRRERMRSEAAGLARLMADPGQSAAP
jgi:23S rRNA pseudouridine1911/1915/1917 synthase